MASPATASLLRGIPQIFVQNTIYALPSRPHTLISDAVLEVSLDGTNFSSNTNSTTGMVSGYAFARCTASTATVLCK